MKSSEALRNAMVDGLMARGLIRGPAIEAALRIVPRHRFASWLSVEDAYADRAHIIPGHEVGAVATISQPTAVALMPEALDLQPGLRVLEIGAGTGYNAAVMAELVGSDGLVVTLDLESDLVEQARAKLHANGYGRVQVLHRDGALGAAEFAPFDRIVATVGLWDLPRGWLEQLAPGGSIVGPLYLGGPPEAHVLVLLKRVGNQLEGIGLGGLDMVLMRGRNAQAGFEGSVQAGPDWQGVAADQLVVKVSFGPGSVMSAAHELVIRKRSCQVVLSARTPLST